MKLLLTSLGHDSIPDFVRGTIAYVPDAARSHGEHEFSNYERDLLRGHGLELVELPLAGTEPEDADSVLSKVDGVYVAGGESFDLLYVLRSTGNDEVLRRHVLAGLPYIGFSAGSIIAGPSVEPASVLDDREMAASISDLSGLGLTEHVVVPHAGGNLPPYPIELVAETVQKYGRDHSLVLLRDGQALLIDDTGTRLV